MRDFDVKLLGHCDDIIDELADLLGWKQELNLLQQAGKDRFEASRTPKKPKATEAAVKTAEKVGEAASKRDSVDVDELSSAIDQVKLEEPKNADKLGERKESQEQEGRTEEDERTEAEEARSDAASSTEPKASL